jgi:hypothetical protein
LMGVEAGRGILAEFSPPRRMFVRAPATSADQDCGPGLRIRIADQDCGSGLRITWLEDTVYARVDGATGSALAARFSAPVFGPLSSGTSFPGGAD